LFEQICQLEEYYLTRTETDILRRHAREMAAEVGTECLMMEYGSGSSTKTPILLRALSSPRAYVPVDISRECLLDSSRRLQEEFPEIPVIPIWADYTSTFIYPAEIDPGARRLIFFPGSTLGNFDPPAAHQFLRNMRTMCGAEGKILLGVDRLKDEAILLPAYDDAQGISAAFNQNLLVRINRELAGNFELEQFRYSARFNRKRQRVEMRQVSRKRQTVQIAGRSIPFEKDESIHLESSYKYSPADFAALTHRAGLDILRVWQDRRGWYDVYLLAPTTGFNGTDPSGKPDSRRE
jgi:dimethylhistidine N-methyltransferase